MLGLFLINAASSSGNNGYRDAKRAMEALGKKPLKTQMKIIYWSVAAFTLLMYFIFFPAGIALTVFGLWMLFVESRAGARRWKKENGITS